ncbi:uncharacterized protein LOC128962984 isoform X3 [Oppia nitens]|uniref:uncharacterized protein LOC128962984 isoform X3 n=1 Tax=Oppia nitens TaxID=1686743 RepID=UPI0023DB32C3|nr:uncharacterized protein LOC128962984 isoform X3 [Oppia nitens]
MSNQMCSLDNGKHSMSSIVNSCSPSMSCSPLTSKPFGPHMLGSMPSPLTLPGHSTHTAFPFPPNPLFFNLFNPQSSMSWFSNHNSLSAPLSLTTNNPKEMTCIVNDNNNNKMDKFKDSTPALIKPNKITDKTIHEPMVTTTEASNMMSSGKSPISESDRITAARNHSDSLANSSRVMPTVPSSPTASVHLALPLTHGSTHASQRNPYIPSLGNDMTGSQRLYSPRFASNSPTYFSYPATNSPIGGPINGLRPVPSSTHFNSPFVSTLNAYQSYSPTTAQNPISPFLVPNQLSVTNTRQTYSTGSFESFHQNPHSQNGHNSHNAILSTNTCSMASTSRSPSLHSSDSSSLISSGPFSSPTISSDSAEPQTKSMIRSIDLQTDINSRSDTNELTNSVTMTGIKRKSPSSPDLSLNEKNLYKLPFGREGSRKHRILKPPNISLDSEKSQTIDTQSAPLSAPPIPGVRRHEFFNKMNDSDINRYPKETIAEQNNCQNMSLVYHQRRKSVPQTSSFSHKSFVTFATKENSKDGSHFTNENSLPNEDSNRLQYPTYFQRGSIIQLGNGDVKRVEDMCTQDFIDSATDSRDLCADCSEVMKIEEKIKNCSVLLSFSVGRDKVPVTVEAPVEHPFFVFHKGWSSYSPERSHHRYGLKCRRLRVGDNCVSLTPRNSLTQNQRTHKSMRNKVMTSEELHQKKYKIKQKILSPPSETPLSLVKSSAPVTTGSTQMATTITTSAIEAKGSMITLNDDKSKPNELLVNKVESSLSKVPEVSELSDVSNLSESVPMNSSNIEETVKTVDRNRRHSAPDAIDIESEPSKAS